MPTYQMGPGGGKRIESSSTGGKGFMGPGGRASTDRELLDRASATERRLSPHPGKTETDKEIANREMWEGVAKRQYRKAKSATDRNSQSLRSESR